MSEKMINEVIISSDVPRWCVIECCYKLSTVNEESFQGPY